MPQGDYFSGLQAMFSNPELRQALEQRVLESLTPPKRNPLGDALRAGGTALMSTPGNFLTGAAAATGPAAQAYSDANKRDPGSTKSALELIDNLVNMGKAESTYDAKMAENARKSAFDDRSLNIKDVLAIIAQQKANTADLDVEGKNRYREGQVDIGQQNAGTNAQKANTADLDVEGKNRYREGQVDIGQRNADTNAQKANANDRNVDSNIATRSGQLAVSQRNADTTRMNTESSIDYRKRMATDRETRTRQDQDNINKGLSRHQSDPDSIYTKVEDTIQRERTRVMKMRESLPPEDFQQELEKYKAWESRFIGGLEPRIQQKYEERNRIQPSAPAAPVDAGNPLGLKLPGS